jgi:CxxC motif-containing protein (DUF1111 family)
MTLRAPIAAAVIAVAASAACPVAAADLDSLLQVGSGGSLTVVGDDRHRLLDPPAGLSEEQLAARRRGEAFFNTPFVRTPARAVLRDGLGPLFNSASCESCHNNLGRGRPPPEDGQQSISLVVQLSWQAPDGRWQPHPVYGPNFNPLAIPGVPVEGRLLTRYDVVPGRYADGTAWTLRRPVYAFGDLGYGALGPRTAFSPRMTQQLVGMGLLEAIPEASILARADPDDRDGDGISGRPNWVTGEDHTRRLGRFGWKANKTDIRAQTVAAFSAEQGITTPDLPGPTCTPAQDACIGMPDGGTPEVDAADLAAIVLFMQTAPVPARVGLESPDVRRGAELFLGAGCAGCHVPVLTTAADAQPGILARQRIHAFTDLLLHDMGPGLADGRPDHEASGSEWRTPPLWGVGRVAEFGSEISYLHDGRARTLAEAVLWHGGEADRSRQAFLDLSSADRAALIAFLNSL